MATRLLSSPFASRLILRTKAFNSSQCVPLLPDQLERLRPLQIAFHGASAWVTGGSPGDGTSPASEGTASAEPETGAREAGPQSAGASHGTPEGASAAGWESAQEGASSAGGESKADEEIGGAGAHAGSSSGWAGADWRQRLPPSGDMGARLRSAAQTVWREVSAAVMPESQVLSATRAHADDIKPPPGASIPMDIAIVVPKESRWQKQWAEWQDKLGLHPLFQRLSSLREAKVFHKGGEVAEALRERWETSDSPVVHKIQDMTENMFAETETAQALREIRARDPAFDMPTFLKLLKNDVPRVIRAYLEGDAPVLKEHCSPEMVERLTGIIAAQHAEGLFSDLNILDVSEVELVDLKYVDGHPVLVVQFTCQQINCSRDKFGNVVEGAPDQVQRIYYYWALQQDPAGFVGTDGRLYAPRWQLREMMLRGMHNLL